MLFTRAIAVTGPIVLGMAACLEAEPPGLFQDCEVQEDCPSGLLCIDRLDNHGPSTYQRGPMCVFPCSSNRDCQFEKSISNACTADVGSGSTLQLDPPHYCVAYSFL